MADISVIITAYNIEAYIEHAIRSALDQQGVAVEVIVVDDCSSDGTAAAIAKISDPRIKSLKLEKNGGPSVARSAGIAAASAPWIAVLDGDDVFLPGRLARLLAHARSVKADMVVDNLQIHREEDGKDFPMFPPAVFSRVATIDLASFIKSNQSFLGGYGFGYLKPIFSSEFLRKHNLAYDPELRIGEDYMLFAEALACGAGCAVVGEAGYVYTVRAGSISHRLSLADVTRISNGDKKFLARYRLNPAAFSAQKRREFALKEAYAFTKLIDALKQRDSLAAFKAIAMCPTAVRHLWRPLWARIRIIL